MRYKSIEFRSSPNQYFGYRNSIDLKINKNECVKLKSSEKELRSCRNIKI